MLIATAATATADGNSDTPEPTGFRNDVLPVLTKAGCNAGACHGALAGKGGFKLSLLGYDPRSDYFAITREARGRRVELNDPGRSLILAKPSGALPHKGGLRLEVGASSYEIVAKWVAEGAGAPCDDDPRVERIEVVPERMTLPPWRRLPAAHLRQDASATSALPAAHLRQDASATSALPAADLRQDASATSALPAAHLRQDASATSALPAADLRQDASATSALPAADLRQDASATSALPAADLRQDASATSALPAAHLRQDASATQIAVRAHYSDGSQRDVTPWVKWSTTNEAVARVDDHGSVTVGGSGEGAVVGWYASKLAIARVTVPYDNDVSPERFANFESRNFIDQHVLARLKRLNLPPSPPADDATFLRRAYLDTIGTLPTEAEVRTFLADRAEDKRSRVIESLLARDEFVDYWAYKWSDVMLVNGQLIRPQAVKAYSEWIRERVAENTPWDEFARQVVTATGSSVDDGQTNFFAVHQDPESMAENVCQAFMGLSVGCARCHNHPLEKWTNDQYYAMANLFARVRAKGWGGERRSGDGERTLFVAARGDLIQPSRGKPQPPTPLDGEPLPFDAPDDRRLTVADWLTSPKNPYFTRAISNRIWANFFGVGLVEPVDDLRVSNPASNEGLLAAAADYLIEHDYDLKVLMRAILESSTYARSSRPLPENETETRFYSRYYPRRMMAEVLHDAVVQVTGVPTPFTELDLRGAERAETEEYPEGTRAIQLRDAAVASRFLKSFGRNPRNIACECERSNEPSMVQVLHIANGDTINAKLRSEKSCVQEFLDTDLPAYRLIEEAYLRTMSRYPSDEEMAQILPILSGAKPDEKREIVEDLFWGLLSSREFLFQH